MIFSIFQKIGFLAILGPPYFGIGATIRTGREMFCLPYAGFLIDGIPKGLVNNKSYFNAVNVWCYLVRFGNLE